MTLPGRPAIPPANAADPRPPRPVFYPTSDGKPMAETGFHIDVLLETIAILRDWFETAHPPVHVGGDLFIYYEEGNPRKVLAPDVFVVKGASREPRMNWLIWNEGKAPDLVIELTSKTTRNEDTGKKMTIYRDIWKVREYFLFDPLAEYLRPRLQGYRLWRGEYRPIQPLADRLPSRILDLHLQTEGNRLRFWDPARNALLLTSSEAYRVEAEARRAATEALRVEAEARRAAAEALSAEAEARRAAEAETEDLRNRLEALRRQVGGKGPKRRRRDG